ncbi:MAG: hypothetical protein LZF86_190460 [Nitrospira sp.]|nr:MAG: hypothetical protein LZF86_190460 [Nitrospira sp.]
MLTNATKRFFYAAQLLRNPTSFVLAVLNDSPYVPEYDLPFACAALSGQERVLPGAIYMHTYGVRNAVSSKFRRESVLAPPGSMPRGASHRQQPSL